MTWTMLCSVCLRHHQCPSQNSLRPHPPACKRLRNKKPCSVKRNTKNKIEMGVERSNLPICTSHKLYNNEPQLKPYKVEELVEAAKGHLTFDHYHCHLDKFYAVMKCAIFSYISVSWWKLSASYTTVVFIMCLHYQRRIMLPM